MDREETEKVVKKLVTEVLGKAAEEVPGVVSGVLTRPVMQHTIKTTYESALKHELANTTAQRAMLRAGETVATKGFARLALIEKATGSVAGILVSPAVELGQVLYEDKIKGEERSARDYRNAAIRGTATGAAGTAATAYTAFMAGIFFPPAAPVLAVLAGLGASGLVGKFFRDNDM